MSKPKIEEVKAENKTRTLTIKCLDCKKEWRDNIPIKYDLSYFYCPNCGSSKLEEKT